MRDLDARLEVVGVLAEGLLLAVREPRAPDLLHGVRPRGASLPERQRDDEGCLFDLEYGWTCLAPFLPLPSSNLLCYTSLNCSSCLIAALLFTSSEDEATHLIQLALLTS